MKRAWDKWCLVTRRERKNINNGHTGNGMFSNYIINVST